MFRAIRNLFGRPDAPSRGRGRRVAKLFIFEFVVVLLGVLAAQLLQDWFSERSEARRAKEAVAALDLEAKRFATIAEYRGRAHQCETARLAKVADLIRSGGSATEAERATPLMPMPVITQWSDDTRRIVTRHARADAPYRYDGLRLLAQMISERQRRLEDQWADFRLLAPEAQSAGNRDSLALAAARAGGLLSAIDMNARSVGQLAPGVQPERKSLEALAKMEHPCAAVALVPAADPAGGPSRPRARNAQS